MYSNGEATDVVSNIKSLGLHAKTIRGGKYTNHRGYSRYIISFLDLHF